MPTPFGSAFGKLLQEDTAQESPAQHQVVHMPSFEHNARAEDAQGATANSPQATSNTDVVMTQQPPSTDDNQNNGAAATNEPVPESTSADALAADVQDGGSMKKNISPKAPRNAPAQTTAPDDNVADPADRNQSVETNTVMERNDVATPDQEQEVQRTKDLPKQGAPDPKVGKSNNHRNQSAVPPPNVTTAGGQLSTPTRNNQPSGQGRTEASASWLAALGPPLSNVDFEAQKQSIIRRAKLPPREEQKLRRQLSYPVMTPTKAAYKMFDNTPMCPILVPISAVRKLSGTRTEDLTYWFDGQYAEMRLPMITPTPPNCIETSSATKDSFPEPSSSPELAEVTKLQMRLKYEPLLKLLLNAFL